MNLSAGCVEACPGCRYRSLSGEESDRRKQAWANACLAPIAVAPILTPAQRWHYRRKALLHAKQVPELGWQFGLLRRVGPQRREAELIAIPDCPLHAPALNERFKVLRTLIPKDIPLVCVQSSGTVLTLVLKCHACEEWRSWARSLEIPLCKAGIKTLFLNWNPSAGRRALSSRHQERIFGPELVRDAGHLHGALSFRQQIPELEEAALQRAQQHLEGAELVVDLYSGAGASLARWLRAGMRAAGVELVGEACRAAEENAPGAVVLKGRVENRLPQLTEIVRGQVFSLYTNPPRDGHSSEVLAWILDERPKKIAYLSCNPRTLARDLTALSAQYEVTGEVQPLDFFPQTDHVECLALLERKTRKPIYSQSASPNTEDCVESRSNSSNDQ